MKPGKSSRVLSVSRRIKGHAGTPCAIQHSAPRAPAADAARPVGAQWTDAGHAAARLLLASAGPPPGSSPRSAWSLGAAQAPAPAPPVDAARFTAFLAELKTEAVDRGISAAVAARALDGLTPLAGGGGTRPRPGRGRPQHRRLRAPAADPDHGAPGPRDGRRATRPILEKVGQAYGVQPRYLVAVWGIESNFGRFTGVRPDGAGPGDAGLRRPAAARSSATSCSTPCGSSSAATPRSTT